MARAEKARTVRWAGRAIVAALVVPAAVAAQQRDEPAERIISLVPAVTEMLFAMGAGANVVGVSSYDTWPPEVATLPKLGALLDPDEERILRLAPDVAILDPGQPALARKLESAGIRTYAFPHADLQTTLAAMEAVGRAIGRGAAGAALAARVRGELEIERERNAAVPAVPALVVFGRSPGGFRNLWVVGGDGFIAEILEIAGGANVFGDVERMSFKVGLEAVLARSPAVVIEVTPSRERTVDVASVAAEWRRLPGFDRVHVVVLTEAFPLVPGPRMPETARLFAEALRGAER